MKQYRLFVKWSYFNSWHGWKNYKTFESALQAIKAYKENNWPWDYWFKTRTRSGYWEFEQYYDWEKAEYKIKGPENWISYID
ncbi:MAG: hypothetical protein JRD68_00090 [Deltaproteobacteria bacterium]|nr:hypothetical protein [Deltaproteobacteria bacterium]